MRIGSPVCLDLPAGEDCTDKSSHCSLARSLDMCKFEFYQKECCSSCGSSASANSTSTLTDRRDDDDDDEESF